MKDPLWDPLRKLRDHMGSLSASFAAADATSRPQTHLPTVIIIRTEANASPSRCSRTYRRSAALRLRRHSSPIATNGTLAEAKASTFDSHLSMGLRSGNFALGFRTWITNARSPPGFDFLHTGNIQMFFKKLRENRFLSESMYKKSINVISGLSSWLRKCAIIQGVSMRADNQAVRAAGRSKAVICFSELLFRRAQTQWWV